MRSRELQNVVRPVQMILTIMWLAMMASVVIYAGVSFAISGSGGQEVSPAMDYAMTGAALLAAIASFVLPKVLLPDERIRRHMQAEEVDLTRLATNPNTGQVDADKLAALEALPAKEQRLAGLRALYFTPWLVGIAAAEAVAVFGLVLATMSRQFDYIIPFAGASLLIMLMKRPSLDKLMDRAEPMAR